MHLFWFACLLVTAALACSTKEVDDTASGATDGSGGAGGGIDCAGSCRNDHPDGAELFDELGLCLLCTECYSDCDGEELGCTKPLDQGLCDGKTVCEDNDSDPSDDCASCALAGPCKAELDACKGTSDCVAFLQCLQPC